MDDTKKEDAWRNRSHPIKEDMSFQRSVWTFERVAWCGLYLFVFLAITGLFSQGPLSTTRIGEPAATLQMDYQRFLRHGALTDMVVFLNTGVDDTTTLHFDSQFVEAFVIEDMSPAPVVSRSSHMGVDYVFDASKAEQITVYLSVRPRRPGLVRSRVNLDNHEAVSFTMFVYP